MIRFYIILLQENYKQFKNHNKICLCNKVSFTHTHTHTHTHERLLSHSK